jgi:SPX domain protein involved in polyphosphate accumulation
MFCNVSSPHDNTLPHLPPSCSAHFVLSSCTPDHLPLSCPSPAPLPPSKHLPTPQFTRSTTKYWVHPAHLTRLKLALCRHLPLLVYGARNPVHHGDIATPGALAAAGAAVRGLVSSGEGGKRVLGFASLIPLLSHSTLVLQQWFPTLGFTPRSSPQHSCHPPKPSHMPCLLTCITPHAHPSRPALLPHCTVYFDNPQLAVYHTRLRRDDGARLVRLRHYGPRVPGQGEAQVWVERKTHRQGWTGERSVKVCERGEGGGGRVCGGVWCGVVLWGVG